MIGIFWNLFILLLVGSGLSLVLGNYKKKVACLVSAFWWDLEGSLFPECSEFWDWFKEGDKHWCNCSLVGSPLSGCSLTGTGSLETLALFQPSGGRLSSDKGVSQYPCVSTGFTSALALTAWLLLLSESMSVSPSMAALCGSMHLSSNSQQIVVLGKPSQRSVLAGG